MKATATISGVHVEIDGTPEECWQFFKKETAFKEILEKIGESSKKIAEAQKVAASPRWSVSGVDSGYETKEQVSDDGNDWIDVGMLCFSRPEHWKFCRTVRK